jgi:hypothetical protein
MCIFSFKPPSGERRAVARQSPGGNGAAFRGSPNASEAIPRGSVANRRQASLAGSTSHLFSQLAGYMVVYVGTSALFVVTQHKKCRGCVLDGLVVKWL